MREPNEQLQTVLVVYTDKRPHTQKNSHAPQPRNQTKLERDGGDANARSMYGARVAGRARAVPASPRETGQACVLQMTRRPHTQKKCFAPHTSTLKLSWNRAAAAPMRAPDIE